MEFSVDWSIVCPALTKVAPEDPLNAELPPKPPPDPPPKPPPDPWPPKEDGNTEKSAAPVVSACCVDDAKLSVTNPNPRIAAAPIAIPIIAKILLDLFLKIF